METLFTSYEEYEQYVTEEWNAGAINELIESEYILPEFEEDNGDIHYRSLTEVEFSKKFKL
jgi:hypothetical protein